MRKIDKLKNMDKVNVLLEQRTTKSPEETPVKQDDKSINETVERMKFLTNYNYECKGFVEIDPEKLIIKEGEDVTESDVTETEDISEDKEIHKSFGKTSSGIQPDKGIQEDEDYDYDSKKKKLDEDYKSNKKKMDKEYEDKKNKLKEEGDSKKKKGDKDYDKDYDSKKKK
ncbi:hypothetical protein COB55_04095 [Candidatus Wolfebacteria bacterium]|nr:MAG: hypothetical protein COB55_04095 [Candidatus Wolfebacteria bacterium]